MTPESAKEYYDRQYTLHREGQIVCRNSIHDLEKAKRRVRAVLQGFDLSSRLQGAEVLDVGCGLGYYTKALSLAGANATGIDISGPGTEVARSTFPECRFRRACWPDDIEKGPQFDLIWSVGLSLINTLDVRDTEEKFINEALQRLKPNGFIILGWKTDFSGRMIGEWSQWSLDMLRTMRRECGLSSPFVPEAGSPWLSWVMVRAGHILRKGVPIFMMRGAGMAANEVRAADPLLTIGAGRPRTTGSS